MHQRVLIAVADGARADLMKQLLDSGELPNIQEHVVARGSFKTALTVFPSTTGPAHIPFVTGLHPGTANVPGYRWLCRKTHDNHRRSIFRHRSLNSPRGLVVGRDMDPEKSTSLFEYFANPSSVLELIDYCPDQPLYKVVVRRLLRIVQAHRSDDWSHVDNMVEELIIKRIRAGSECIVGSFFGIDEYSHLYDPFDDRTKAAYRNIDSAIGHIADVLKTEGVYDETIIAIVSDHGLSATTVHIPLVDIVTEHGFDPYFYPKLYRRRRDCAVMESGNAMAALYFKHDSDWGNHWRWDEMDKDKRISKLITTLRTTKGVSFVGGRYGNNGVIWAGRNGKIMASRVDGHYNVRIEGDCPLGEHPVGRFTPEELFEQTFNHTYPDAINQLFMLLASPRSGDLAISSEPGYDLRLQHEDPEHHSSHGSLHREHMQVPLMTSVPLGSGCVSNYDLVPTVLELCGKTATKPLDGVSRVEKDEFPNLPSPAAGHENTEVPVATGGNLGTILTTIAIILSGLVISAVFKDDILSFGKHLMVTYGESWVDVILTVVTAISSTPLALPIWAYELIGIALGYSVLRISIFMALGSATGSLVTFLLGKHFGNGQWVKKRFPNVHKHPWAKGKSRRVVSLLLFLGTVSPIPCDVFYVACGAKKYPTVPFWLIMVAARFVRYIYMGYGFLYFREFFDYFL